MSAETTRLRLVEAAERLFAERGLNGVSLREIGVAAGQRNSSAVLYHLGSKDELVRAVFEHRMGAINERRMAMLTAFDSHGLGDDLRALTEAIVLPLADLLGEADRPSWYMRFCVHAGLVEPAIAEFINAHGWSLGVRTIRERLDVVLADLPDGVRADRWLLYTGYVIHAMADREAAIQTAPETITTDRQTFLGELVDTAVAILSTSARQETRASRPSTIVAAKTK